MLNFLRTAFLQTYNQFYSSIKGGKLEDLKNITAEAKPQDVFEMFIIFIPSKP